MKEYNITAQVYENIDKYKQTLIFNKQVAAKSKENAVDLFTNYHLVPHYRLVKIYSVEEIPQEPLDSDR